MKNNKEFWLDLKTMIEGCKPGYAFTIKIPANVKLTTIRSKVCALAKPLRKKFRTVAINETLQIIRTDNGLISSLDPSTFPHTKPFGGSYSKPHSAESKEFKAWPAYKAHAEEMAKPEARYATIGGIVNLYFDVNLSKPGVCSVAYFESVEAAEVWASNNGYRVVEE